MACSRKAGWVWLALLLAVLVVAGVFCARRPARPQNAIMVIAPYRYEGTWVFDDPSTGLRRERFVAGIPEMIDRMVKDIPHAGEGFRLTFSAQPFPGYEHKLEWRRGDRGGNWYYCADFGIEGWLCPALFKYYDEAPKEIYARADQK